MGSQVKISEAEQRAIQEALDRADAARDSASRDGLGSRSR